MKKVKTDVEKIVIEKAPQVAFCSLEGCHVKPLVSENGRVKFEVTGEVSKALSKLASNPLVHIQDYLTRLDTVRSVIFTMKGERK